jgi:hypothetical protein
VSLGVKRMHPKRQRGSKRLKGFEHSTLIPIIKRAPCWHQRDAGVAWHWLSMWDMSGTEKYACQVDDSKGSVFWKALLIY